MKYPALKLSVNTAAGTGNDSNIVSLTDTSNVFSESICTPPIPPVAKNLIPNFEAIKIVEATVVVALVLLDNDKVRIDVAKAGQNRTITSHNYKVRCEQLNEYLREIL